MQESSAKKKCPDQGEGHNNIITVDEIHLGKYEVTQRNIPRKKLNKMKSYKDRNKLCSGDFAQIY